MAAAGLLDGKRAATHWRYAAELARRFHAVSIDADVLYVDEGNVITSSGSAGGIDMGLHLIRRDFGAAVANTVARRLVTPPHRDGGQMQYVETPVADADKPSPLLTVLAEMRRTLAEQHTVSDIARRAHMSTRTFARRFKATTGTSPHRWLQAQRVRHAQRLLEKTSLPLRRIAEESGFSDVQLLRLHFKRLVGTPPGAHRRGFQGRL